ncbi:MAG: hypothetical protein ACTHJM_15315 [Marmoricola sp.]
MHVGRDQGIGWLGVLGTLALGPYLASRYGGVDGIRVCLAFWAFSWVTWVAILRPRVNVEGSTVVLDSALRDVSIPAAVIEDVRLGAYLTITARGRTYTTAAVGASRRQYRRSVRRKAGIDRGQDVPRLDDGALVVASIQRAVEHAKGSAPQTSEVTATWAVAPIVTLLLLCLSALATIAF